jgi:nucleotide-binding universal stress UspA family protein
MLKPTKILIPTDFSEYSNMALRQAFDIAKQYKAKVYVLHVVHGESYYEDVEKQMIEGARKKLQEEIDKFPQAKELEVFTEVVSGNTSEAILTEERSKGIDLIVIASLGRSGIAKYLIGSVARNVLKGAKCPVLLTK